MPEIPSVRRVVVLSKLCSLERQIKSIEQELSDRKRLLDLLNWEYSSYLIEQAALNRTLNPWPYL